MNHEHLEQHASFNQDFCVALEFHLCATFQQCSLKEFHRLWCDGVDPDPEKLPAKDDINQRPTIVTRAWLGEDGQEVYRMTIYLGPAAIRRYTNGLSLTDCLPEAATMDWWAIDTQEKTLEIALL